MDRLRWTKAVRARFLDVLRRTGNVSEAARAVSLSRSRAYQIRRTDQDFASAWDDAEAEAVDSLEAEAWRRAAEGIEEPLVSAGKLVRWDDGTVVTLRRYNDRLLEFLLKAHRPEKFKDRAEKDAAPPAAAGPMPPVHVRIEGGE